LKRPVATSCLSWSSWAGLSQPGSPLYSREHSASRPSARNRSTQLRTVRGQTSSRSATSSGVALGQPQQRRQPAVDARVSLVTTELLDLLTQQGVQHECARGLPHRRSSPRWVALPSTRSLGKNPRDGSISFPLLRQPKPLPVASDSP